MAKKVLVTQSYVRREDGQEYSLEYYIIDYTAVGGRQTHGIEIRMFSRGLRESVTSDVAGSREDVLKLILLLARNFVMPVSLHDLMEDLDVRRR